jgi:predicted kinase
MEWKDIAGIVGKAAPILGTVLGGPAGGLVGGMVAAALGTENTPDAVNAAIAADPASALKLAQLESDEKVKLQQMLYDHADKLIEAGNAGILADVDDRKSARQAAVSGDTTKHVFWLSVVLITVTLTAEIVAMFHGVSDNADPLIVGRVLGMLDSAALLVLNFTYGSSSGSKRATELLAKSTPAAEPNVATGP